MADALIGRHAELAQVVDALKLARSGQATTVVVRGEAGIGKSRFLAEALAQADLLGHTTQYGRVDDLDRLVPFAGLRLALLSKLRAEKDPKLRVVASDVEAGLDAAGTDEATALPTLVGDLEQLLRVWSGRQPLVLALDDLHAVDTDTLTLLSQLVRRLQADRVTFLATTRAHPPDASPELTSIIERLGRDGLATIVDLTELDVDDVRALIRTELDAQPEDRLVDTVWQATRGNPFYVEEGVRSLRDAGEIRVDDGQAHLTVTATPAVLRSQSTIVYRLFNLGPAARSVARALTAFRRFDLADLDLLADLAELSPGEVEKAFDTLAGAHLLVAVDDGYEFAHPIVRHTLYEDLGPAERRRTHAAIAAHLTAARDAGRPVPIADLATHVSASADPGDDDAVALLVDAAAAVSARAPASAAAWFGRALDLLGDDDARRPELLADQAKALFLSSQLDRAATVAAAALDDLPPGHLRSRTAGLQVTTLTALGRLDEALATSDAILDGSDEPLPRLHAERGALLVFLDRFADAEAEGDLALELAGDDDGARALGFRALSTIAHERADIAERERLYTEQLRLAERLGPAARLSAVTTHAMHLSLLGFIGEAETCLADATALRAELGGAALQDALDVATIINDWNAGRWDAALERLRWMALPPSPGEAWLGLARSAALVIHGLRAEVGAGRRLAGELGTGPIGFGTRSWALANFALATGELDEAAALLDEAWRRNELSGRRVDAAHLLGTRVEVELDRGDDQAARRWANTAEEVLAPIGAPATEIVRLRVRAATGPDVGPAAEATAIAERHGLVLEAAKAHLLLGARGVDPADHLGAAHETFRELGAESLRRQAARAMKDAGLDAPRPKRAAKGELSDTERKLSQLVYDGLTNREIARVLIVSPKTVEVYLSRLFAKTGCESRVELAVAVSEGRI